MTWELWYSFLILAPELNFNHIPHTIHLPLLPPPLHPTCFSSSFATTLFIIATSVNLCKWIIYKYKCKMAQFRQACSVTAILLQQWTFMWLWVLEKEDQLLDWHVANHLHRICLWFFSSAAQDALDAVVDVGGPSRLSASSSSSSGSDSSSSSSASSSSDSSDSESGT